MPNQSLQNVVKVNQEYQVRFSVLCQKNNQGIGSR